MTAAWRRAFQTHRRLSDGDFLIGIGREIAVDLVGRHVNAAERRVEETSDSYNTVERSRRHEIEWRKSTERRRAMRASQPRDAILFGGVQDLQRGVNAKHTGNTGELIVVERYVVMFARRSGPVLVDRAGRTAEDELALLLGELPQIGDGDEGAKARPAESTAVFRAVGLRIDARRPDGNG